MSFPELPTVARSTSASPVASNVRTVISFGGHTGKGVVVVGVVGAVVDVVVGLKVGEEVAVVVMFWLV